MLHNKCSVILVGIVWMSLSRLIEGRAFNHTAYQIMVSARASPAILTLLEKGGISDPADKSAYQILHKFYYNLQKKHFEASVKMVEEAETSGRSGYNEVESSCFFCQSVGDDRLSCFTKCLTQNLGMDDIMPFSNAIAEAMNNYFCKPIGFKFLEEFYSRPESLIWTRFTEFMKSFIKDTDGFATGALTDIWSSNVLLLQQSPLFFLSYLRASMANTITKAGTYDQTKIDVNNLTPAMFASMCSNTFAADIAPAIYNFMMAAKNHRSLLDVALRGLFSMRSSSFYAPLSGHHKLAGSILEVLGAVTGRKCNLLGYADDKSDDCDDVGLLPMPNFPYPSVAEHLMPACE